MRKLSEATEIIVGAFYKTISSIVQRFDGPSGFVRKNECADAIAAIRLECI